MGEYDEENEDEISYFGGVEEHGNQFGVWKRGKFLALSNFKIHFRVEVQVQKERANKGDLCGYICVVTYLDGKVLG